MPPQFKSMNELNDYLDKLEQRVNSLEAENQRLRQVAPVQANVDGNVIARYVSHVLPNTNLISPNFLKHAFTVWGHFFVAQLIIGLTFGLCYLCLMAVFFGSVFNNLLKSMSR